MRLATATFAVALASGMTLAVASPVAAQRGFGGACQFSYDNEGYFISPFAPLRNPVYEGRLTFARIKYKGSWLCGEEGPGWAHDYPITESHLIKIMAAVTSLRPLGLKTGAPSGTILSWKDPELLKYPIAWLSEPGSDARGGWTMDQAELAGFKRYIERGGFVIFDDMGWQGRDDLPNLMGQWQRAFPNAQLTRLAQDHPIFNTFFKVDLALITAYCNNAGCYGDGQRGPEYYAIFQDNDPKKRMLAVINNNNDLGEFMQFSDRGFHVVPSNEAYKLTINYFIYALTH